MKMINNILKPLSLSMIVLMSAASCNDFLDETSPNEVQKNMYYKDLSETEATLVSTYAAFKNQYLMNIEYEAYRADLAWPGYGRPSARDVDKLSWYNHEYENSNTVITSKWSAIYKGLFCANQTIEGLNKFKGNHPDMDEKNLQQWNEQMGQALFFRGLFHHYLSLSFRHTDGKCAMIVDQVPENFNEFYKPLATPEEVTQFARKDLKEAFKLLPPVYGTETIEQGTGRVTAAAAATILGNSYLFNEDLDSAMIWYNEVITNPDYKLSLYQDVDNMFTYAGEFNSESILEINYNKEFHTELSQWDNNAQTNRLGNAAQNMNLPVWLVFEYAHEPMDTLDSRNYYDSIPDLQNPTVSYKHLRKVPLRCSAMAAVAQDVNTPYFGAKNTTAGLITSNIGYGFGYCRKYTEDKEVNGKRGDWYSGENVIVDRLSEVYLNYAECLIRTGKLDEGREYLNKIRRRWGLVNYGLDDGTGRYTYDNVNYTQEQLMDKLMFVDKPLELANEGYETRWIDLRRWGKVEERYKDLASRTYYITHFGNVTYSGGKYVVSPFTATGETIAAKWNSTVVDYPSPLIDWTNSSSKYNIIDYEYDKVASQIDKVDKERFGYYYPIPLQEVQNNINIK